MPERYKQLSGYQVMWVWVLFDLPVGTKTERKRATQFRNDLLDLGFEMVQFSVYLRHAWSREKAESFAQQVGGCVPEAGHVQVLFFTDRQYAQSQVFRGRTRPAKPDKKPRQLVLF
ncbi:MAG: CRISPR-associated endonuclease Cas2 [Roseovarius sp.]|nr:CRISPR-associated endonuclease Cas2 [Roseovarius sp.]